jgi:hypothetical protein
MVENKDKNIKRQMGRGRGCTKMLRWQLHRHFYATSLITSVSSNEHYFLNISTSYTSFMVFDHKYMAREALAEVLRSTCIRRPLSARRIRDSEGPKHPNFHSFHRFLSVQRLSEILMMSKVV